MSILQSQGKQKISLKMDIISDEMSGKMNLISENEPYFGRNVCQNEPYFGFIVSQSVYSYKLPPNAYHYGSHCNPL